MDASGAISEDTVWNADTVRVVGDVTVLDGVTLSIQPGVRVEFQDYYRLDAAGTLLAVGTPEQRIVFTTDEPQAFGVDGAHTGCWNGIRFDETAAANAPSRLAYCVIEYSKATGGGGGVCTYGGGAVSVVDFSKLTIENCIIRTNVAEYGGALFCYRNANPTIVGNLLVDNHALQNAAAVYCAYSHPKIANNTIVNNRIHNEQNPYSENCAVLSFISKPVFTNNIIRDNEPFSPYLDSQIWQNKAYYTHYNDIEDYETVGGNFDAEPLFADPGGWDDQGTPSWSDDVWVDGDHRLLPGSPCIDAGDNAATAALATDLIGSPRFADDPFTPDGGPGPAPVVDVGACEYQDAMVIGDLNCDGVRDFADVAAFVLALVDAAAYANAYPDCDRNRADCNHDQSVDALDVALFVSVLTGE